MAVPLTGVWRVAWSSLESQAGIPKEKIVAAHGNFDGARCIACKAAADPAKVK
jgi:NAD-dependent SIR2 family protein deacetylase